MATRRRRSIFDIINEYFENLEEWAKRSREALIEKPSWDHRACTIEPPTRHNGNAHRGGSNC